MDLRMGVVGSGGIVRQCLQALPHVEDLGCDAILVREPKVALASELAAAHGFSKVYTDYRAMLEDEELDVIYIGIINSLHFLYARQALLAGKHVICEKPFTSTASQAEALKELAESRGLYLFEAITMLHSPNYLELRNELVRIGQPRLVQCNYSQYSSRYDAYLHGEVLPSFDPALSGGALYDINIYNLHFTAGLFGMPRRVIYRANKGFNGIDLSGTVIMEYDGLMATCTGAKDSNSPGFVLVQGTEGYMRIKGAAYLTESLEIETKSLSRQVNLHTAPHYMVEELADFARVIRTDDRQTARDWLEHSLTVMRIAEEARKSAGIEFAEDYIMD